MGGALDLVRRNSLSLAVLELFLKAVKLAWRDGGGNCLLGFGAVGGVAFRAGISSTVVRDLVFFPPQLHCGCLVTGVQLVRARCVGQHLNCVMRNPLVV